MTHHFCICDMNGLQRSSECVCSCAFLVWVCVYKGKFSDAHSCLFVRMSLAQVQNSPLVTAVSSPEFLFLFWSGARFCPLGFPIITPLHFCLPLMCYKGQWCDSHFCLDLKSYWNAIHAKHYSITPPWFDMFYNFIVSFKGWNIWKTCVKSWCGITKHAILL